MNGIYGGNEDNSRARLNSLENPYILEHQKAFIRKCSDTLGDLDNVLYEIINEAEDTEQVLQWQYHMINYVKQYESLKGKQHPAGMTAVDGGQFNALLWPGWYRTSHWPPTAIDSIRGGDTYAVM